MDVGLPTGAIASLNAAAGIGRAALEIRDMAKLSGEVLKLNGAVLDAQQSLFKLSAELLALQQQHFETAEKLRKANEALAERGRYTLVQVSLGQWAYRVDVAPQASGSGEPRVAQPAHYVCQKCFDEGRKVVLQHSTGSYLGPTFTCPGCKTDVYGSPVD